MFHFAKNFWGFSIFVVVCVSTTTTTTNGHVALKYPPARTDNDYLYTFDGSCEGDSCDGFCGDPYINDNNPITTLQVGVPITLRWYSPVPHSPHKYRLSLNRQSSDGRFDSLGNILTIVDAEDAAVDDATEETVEPSDVGPSPNMRSRQRGNNFSTKVTVPTDALQYCSGPDPCVLQLFDLYYFVSCSNVLLTAEELGGPNMTSGDDNNGGKTIETLPSFDGEGYPIFLVEGASFEDYRVTVDEQEPQLDPILTIKRCESYTFAIDAPGHPFVIKTKPGIGGDDLYDGAAIEDQGLEVGAFRFEADAAAPSKLYYQCTLHPEMVGEIQIIDGGDACTKSGVGFAGPVWRSIAGLTPALLVFLC